MRVPHWLPPQALLAIAAIVSLVGIDSHKTAHAAAPPGRYTLGIDPDSTAWAKDTQTGLTWKQHEEPAIWPWTSASAQCTGTWRLPNIRELRSIVDDTRATAPALDPGVFPGANLSVSIWTSTPDASFAGNAWSVSFNDGSTPSVATTTNNGIRCVR